MNDLDRQTQTESMTLNEAQDRFVLNLLANGRKPATIANYRRRWGLLPFPADMQLHELTPELLDSWAASLEHLADATRLAYIQALKTLTGFCFRRGYIERDPACDLHRPKLDMKAQSNGKVMRVQDLFLILDTCDRQTFTGIRDFAVISFIAGSGARRGEVASLILSGLRLETLEADVEGKSGKRVVTYPQAAVDALNEWLELRPDTGHDFVFMNTIKKNVAAPGAPMTENAITLMFKRRAKLAGVRGAGNPHAVRHLVGQEYTDKSNLALAQAKLGHADVSTTARFYAHQDQERVKAADSLHSVLNSYRSE